MSPLSLIGAIGLICAIVQLTCPEFVLSLKPSGIKSVEAVKLGGYIGLVVSPIFIIVDIFIL